MSGKSEAGTKPETPAMAKRLFLVLLLAACCAPAAASTCSGSIAAEMVDRVDSGKAKPGDIFRFRTAADAKLGNLPIPQGTLGRGIVRNVDQAGRKDHNGSLALEPRYLIDGKHIIPVTMEPHLPASWSPSQTLIEKGAGRIPNPVSGIVMSGVNLMRYGKNITLGPGFTFTILLVPSLAGKSICPQA